MNSIPAEVAATGEGTVSTALLFMLLRDSSSGLAICVATVVLVAGVGSTTVWTGAAVTVLDGVPVRSIVGAGVRVKTAVEAGGRPAVVVGREASEVVFPTGATEAEENETTWENMPTEGTEVVDELGAQLGFSGSTRQKKMGTISQYYQVICSLMATCEKHE